MNVSTLTTSRLGLILAAVLSSTGCDTQAVDALGVDDITQLALDGELEPEDLEAHLEARPNLHRYELAVGDVHHEGFYELDDEGQAVAEGDIIIGTPGEDLSEEQEGQGLRSAFINIASRRWPGQLVFYTLAGTLTDTQRSRALEAMDIWHDAAGYNFVEVPLTFSGDRVYVIRSVDNKSPVGRQGGTQLLYVSPGAGTATYVHEFGHAIGLWHEHTSPVRDAFVDINWACVAPDRWHDYLARSFSDASVRGYNFRSVMHYGGSCQSGSPLFGLPGQRAITPKPGFTAFTAVLGCGADPSCDRKQPTANDAEGARRVGL